MVDKLARPSLDELSIREQRELGYSVRIGNRVNNRECDLAGVRCHCGGSMSVATEHVVTVHSLLEAPHHIPFCATCGDPMEDDAELSMHIFDPPEPRGAAIVPIRAYTMDEWLATYRERIWKRVERRRTVPPERRLKIPEHPAIQERRAHREARRRAALRQHQALVDEGTVPCEACGEPVLMRKSALGLCRQCARLEYGGSR